MRDLEWKATAVADLTEAAPRSRTNRRTSSTASAGSHGTLYAGDRRTTVKDRKKEIGKGLLNKMLADLGIDRDEFWGTE